MFLLAFALQSLLPSSASTAAPNDSVLAGFDTPVLIVTPGTPEEHLLRMREFSSPNAPSQSLLRRPLDGLASGPQSTTGWTWGLITPRLRTVWNSRLPFSLNEGSLWAGRGVSSLVSGGFLLKHGDWALRVAPELVFDQNRDFQTFSRPEVEPTRHGLASAFHYPPESADVPQRPGYQSEVLVIPGQSRVSYSIDSYAVGYSTENLWWGPGIRNGLVMSSNAPGIPHVFAGTEAPVSALGGKLEGRWILGRLSESEYFDFDPENDYRSINALAVSYSPDAEPGLTVGFSRAVYAPARGTIIPFPAILNVLRDVGRPASEPGDTLLDPGPDQLFSIFGEWRFPESGVAVHFEWGRYERPPSLSDLLTMPGHSQGYTFGGRWISDPVFYETRVSLQTEVTSLEPSASYRVRSVHDWYTSRTVPQGYTHRGRVIGASIGPAGSSQWFSADLVDPEYAAGLSVGRIRWENGAQFSYPPEFRYADVTFWAGLRGSMELGYLSADLQYIHGFRYNYLFQAQPTSPIHHRGVDIPNRSLMLTLSAGQSWLP